MSSDAPFKALEEAEEIPVSGLMACWCPMHLQNNREHGSRAGGSGIAYHGDTYFKEYQRSMRDCKTETCRVCQAALSRKWKTMEMSPKGPPKSKIFDFWQQFHKLDVANIKTMCESLAGEGHKAHNLDKPVDTETCLYMMHEMRQQGHGITTAVAQHIIKTLQTPWAKGHLLLLNQEDAAVYAYNTLLSATGNACALMGCCGHGAPTSSKGEGILFSNKGPNIPFG